MTLQVDLALHFKSPSVHDSIIIFIIIIIIIVVVIYPLTARVFGALQMINFASSFFSLSHHFSLFSTAFWDLANSRPVHSLMPSSHLFLCLPCLLPSFTVPCKMVVARPDEREIGSFHCGLRHFTIVFTARKVF